MAELPLTCPIPRWQLLKQQLTNVDAITFNRLLAEEKYQLLDVRTDDEFAAFHLPGARNMNYLGPDFLEQLDQLNSQQTYLVYCRSGRRSVRACTLMKNAGINNIIHLDGGLNSWQTEENKTNQP